MYYVDGPVPLYKFDIFRDFEDVLRHGVSTRKGGVSEGEHTASLNLCLALETAENLQENYRRFAEAVDIPQEKIIIAWQEHTDKVVVVDEKSFDWPQGDFGGKEPVESVDGFITATCGLPIMVRFADCQGVMFFDPVKKVIAMVHCGWRGNAQNILGKTVKKMASEFNCLPENILLGIGPSLEPEASEFSDPFNELPEAMHKYVDSDNKVNLWECSRDQLMAEGILDKNIEIAGLGTFANPAEFFSHRYSGGNMGHMGGVIMLT